MQILTNDTILRILRLALQLYTWYRYTIVIYPSVKSVEFNTLKYTFIRLAVNKLDLWHLLELSVSEYIPEIENINNILEFQELIRKYETTQ